MLRERFYHGEGYQNAIRAMAKIKIDRYERFIGFYFHLFDVLLLEENVSAPLQLNMPCRYS